MFIIIILYKINNKFKKNQRYLIKTKINLMWAWILLFNLLKNVKIEDYIEF